MRQGYTNLKTLRHVVVDLRYASLNNFTGENVYGEFNEAYLHDIAAEKLQNAANSIHSTNPGFRLLILDALRPRWAQKKLFAKVKDTPQQKYVADPERGSVHNYGMAVDLTVINSDDQELDMGAGFDDFRDLSEPSKEQMFFTQGLLTKAHLENRHLLRDGMVAAGFLTIPHEWWHFNALALDEIKGRFPVVE